MRGHAVSASIVMLALLAGGLVFRYNSIRSRQTTEAVARLAAEVTRLSQEQAMPTVVLTRHRNSICYIYALYTLAPPPGTRFAQPTRTRVSGTGFVVASGVIATNRHVVEPWYDDDADEAMIARGAVPNVDKLVAFCPDLPRALPLTKIEVSPTADLAIAHFAVTKRTSSLRPLPLATAAAVPGDAVVVVGYPMGITAMLAKSPRKLYKRLAYSRDTIDVARDLARNLLIRPSATYGHLGDVVEERLVYDAPTAQGGSGGPVFNSQGQVIGVNAAYIDGFAGGTMGISIEALRPLLAEGRAHQGIRGPQPQSEHLAQDIDTESASEDADPHGGEGAPGADFP